MPKSCPERSTEPGKESFRERKFWLQAERGCSQALTGLENMDTRQARADGSNAGVVCTGADPADPGAVYRSQGKCSQAVFQRRDPQEEGEPAKEMKKELPGRETRV